jgi:hypothetical protein
VSGLDPRKTQSFDGNLVRLLATGRAKGDADGCPVCSGEGVSLRIARLRWSIMTARLGAIMETAEAADVVGVSIGNHRSALDAKGGSRSSRATALLYRTGRYRGEVRSG